MIKTHGHLRYALIATVIVLYFLPVLLLSGYGVRFFPSSKGWMFLSAGLLFATVGSVALILRITSWESKLWDQLDQLGSAKAELLLKKQWEAQVSQIPQDLISKSELEETSNKLKLASQAHAHLEKQVHELNQELDALKNELNLSKTRTETQLSEKSQLNQEYSQLIHELRHEIEERNETIGRLEETINDLHYEIQTLVQVNAFEKEEIIVPKPEPQIVHTPVQQTHIPAPPYPTEKHAFAIGNEFVSNGLKSGKTPEEISSQLKRCLDIAQKMTGASHFGINPRFQDLGLQSLALEQRRLFDNLEIESREMTMVYSQKEDRLLFVNQSVREISGWSQDQFVHEFFHLIQNSLDDWRKALIATASRREVPLEMILKTRSGAEMTLQCLMGSIPTGIFKNHIIAILY